MFRVVADIFRSTLLLWWRGPEVSETQTFVIAIAPLPLILVLRAWLAVTSTGAIGSQLASSAAIVFLSAITGGLVIERILRRTRGVAYLGPRFLTVLALNLLVVGLMCHLFTLLFELGFGPSFESFVKSNSGSRLLFVFALILPGLIITIRSTRMQFASRVAGIGERLLSGPHVKMVLRAQIRAALICGIVTFAVMTCMTYTILWLDVPKWFGLTKLDF